jgi:hypothetical protein
MKTAGRGTQTVGPECPATEHMTRQVRKDPDQTSSYETRGTPAVGIVFFLTSPCFENNSFYTAF